MIALFARANHPQGYGSGGGAHGYVVVGVRCRSQKQIDRVVKHIVAEGFDLPDEGRTIYPKGKPDRLHERQVRMYPADAYKDEARAIRWYSGGPYDWDYLFTVAGNAITWPGGWASHGSRGDNRFTMVYDAKDVLAAR